MANNKRQNTWKQGRVNIEVYKTYYRLRWTFEGVRRSLVVCPIDTEGGLNLAKAKAKEIDTDINKAALGFGEYDTTLAKYSLRHEPKKPKETLWNLLEIWEDYKARRKNFISHSTQKNSWRAVDSYLLNTNYLSQKNVDALVDYLLTKYKPGTLLRPFGDIVTATNLWSKRNNINNPWREIKALLPRSRKTETESRSKQAWGQAEVNAVLNYFETNDKHSFYHPYVTFLAYTGCRPEEAIALTWDDIYWENSYTLFDKAYTYGKLNQTTKTGRSRRFPVNRQLDSFLRNNVSLESKLLFPAVKGGYLDQRLFNRRHFKPVVAELHKAGVVSKVMPTYNLRNTWITLMLQKRIDIASVAKLVGTSEEMILTHYWGADDNIIVPEI
ncbi:MAG: tyrosine-type recombinase/integrase [Cyanobacteria bacterium P01_H01_bin.35]